MKAWLPLGLAAVLALGLGLRRTPPAAADGPRAVEPAPPPHLAPPPAPPPGNDVRLLAIRAVETDEALPELRDRLILEPGRWEHVIDVLCSIDDPKAVARVADGLGAAVDPASEERFLELLRSGPTSHARRFAVAVLVTRDSSASLSGLTDAARSDVDRLVRYEALKALARRKDRARSEAETIAIADVLRRRAQGEPDTELRNIARRLSGEAVPGDVEAPRPARRTPLKPR